MFESIKSKIIEEFHIFDYDSAIFYLDLVYDLVNTAQTMLLAQFACPDEHFIDLDVNISVDEFKNELKVLADTFNIENFGYVKTADFEAKIRIVRMNLNILEKLYTKYKNEFKKD